MREEGKWTRRAKWIVSCAITVFFTVLISSIVIDTMKTAEISQEVSDDPPPTNAQVSGKPDSEVTGLPIEKAAIFDLLKIDGYGPTIEDIPDIPSGCDSEVLAKTISETIENLSDDTKVVLNLEHQIVRYLPAPSIVWISEQEDSYPVIFLYQDNETVTVSDPSRGMVTYPVREFDDIYRNAGSQSVYITDRGYIIK